MVNTIDIAKLRAISEILNFNSESKIKEPNYNMLNVNTKSAALYGGGGGGVNHKKNIFCIVLQTVLLYYN